MSEKVMEKKDKLIEFLLTEHKDSTKHGIFKVDYGYKFSFLEMPEIQKAQEEGEEVISE